MKVVERGVSADQAVSVVRPGDRVFIGSACATPWTLVEALGRLRRPGVVLVHFLTSGLADAALREVGYPHRVFYVGSALRGLDEPGRVEYLPLSLADIPRLFQSGRL